MSPQHADIYAVLQHIINTHTATRPVFVNGDCVFINALLGLMSPAATHPCFICTVSKDYLHMQAAYRPTFPTYNNNR